MSIFRKVLHAMGTFLDSVKDDIAKIHATNGATGETTEQVNAAIAAAVAPLQASVSDAQEAIKQVVAHLNAGDVAAATEAANTAAAATDTVAAAVAPTDAAAATDAAPTA